MSKFHFNWLIDKAFFHHMTFGACAGYKILPISFDHRLRITHLIPQHIFHLFCYILVTLLL